MNNDATIVCWHCKKRVNLIFRRVFTPDKRHWEATCPWCGTFNYIYRPSWDQQPIFRKYRREYLAEVTGYSLEYLCRVARGANPLGQTFMDRCCHKLKEPQRKLFDPE